MREMQVQSLGGEDPLEEGMASHSSSLAWRISWTEEPGRLPSIESQRVNTTEMSIRRRISMIAMSAKPGFEFAEQEPLDAFIEIITLWTSLVVQWLRICLPMQETQVYPRSEKIPHALEQFSPYTPTTEAHSPRAHNPQQEEATSMRSPRSTTKSSPYLPQLEKAVVQQ